MGSKKFLSMLNQMDLIAGNSSSGIIEAPSIKIPTLNIGVRQKGRECAKSIFNCEPKKILISNLIKKLLYKKKNTFNFTNPYEKKFSSKNIIKGFRKHKDRGQLKQKILRSMKDITIQPDQTIISAMKKIEQTGERSLIVVTKSQKFLGTLTDGDIRRNIIKGVNLKNKINKIYKKAIYLYENKFSESQVKKILIKQNNILIPIIDSSKVFELFNLEYCFW